MTIRTHYFGLWSRFLCVLLAIVMATGPSASVMAQTNAAQQAVRKRAQALGSGQVEAPERPEDLRREVSTDLIAPPAAGKIDTTYVPPGAVGIAVLRPAQILKSPMAEMLPTEVAAAAGLKYLGFDPADVDEAVAFVDMSNPTAPPTYGLSIKFNKPFKGSAIPQEIRAHTQLAELNGKKYLQSQHPMMPSFYGPNNMTLVVAPDEILRQLITAKDPSATGPILDRIRDVPGGNDLYVAVDLTSMRPLIQMGLAGAQREVPPQFQHFLEAPNLISAAELTVNLSKPGTSSLIAHANDDTAAQQLETMLGEVRQMYQDNLRQQFAQQATSDDPIERAMAQYGERMSGNWSNAFMPKRDGSSFVFFRTDVKEQNQQQQMVAVAVIGILVALLLPAIQAAREAARRNHSMNNLKQMMIALQNHHDVKGAFPAHASYSDDGKPLLSWRVHILPFVEENVLYDQFRLDEPWDSEHNKALLERMPQVYRNPNLPLEAGKTNYLAVVGEECVFDGTKDGKRLQQITDGTSKTICVVEAAADQAVEWTKPDDWEYDAQNPKTGLGGIRPGGWLAGFCDAHIEFISDEIDLEVLKAMFTSAGAEVIPNF